MTISLPAGSNNSAAPSDQRLPRCWPIVVITPAYGRATAASTCIAPANFDPKSNVITRAVGACAALDLDAAYGAIRDGDRFLLCSDGLSSVLDEREIAGELNRAPAERAADRLINRALARNAGDNVTVVIVIAEALRD
jgi:serine/threonine protein phosphatase PrpC